LIGSEESIVWILAKEVVQMGGATPPMSNDENWGLFKLEILYSAFIMQIFKQLKRCG
jgi:hypothetical protein